MKNTIFTGMATAIVTPMTETGIDYDALGRLIEFQIESGINAIVVMGTTGENATIEPADQEKVIRYTIEKVAHRIPVIAGTGTNNTEHVIANTKAACAAGADAVLGHGGNDGGGHAGEYGVLHRIQLLLDRVHFLAGEGLDPPLHF